VLAVRNVDGRLHVARKERRPVYGPGDSHDFDVIT
jgi:hypothetical protein